MPTADPTLHPAKAEIRNVSMPAPLWPLLDTIAEQAAVPRSRIVRAAVSGWLLENVDVVVDGGRYAVTGIPRPRTADPAPITVDLSRGDFEHLVGGL